MNRAWLFALALPLAGQALPGWWTGLSALPRLDSAFRQESESAVFGKLVRRGRIQAAKGGKLRVAYDSGLLLVADGEELVQYDPDTRTAQRMSLRSSLQDAPLLALLLDPTRLEKSYAAKVEAGGRLRLSPKAPGIPPVVAEGHGRFLTALSWSDGTGAAQRLVLEDPKSPAAFDPKLFRFAAPEGTRFVGGR